MPVTHEQETCANFRASFPIHVYDEQYTSNMKSTHNHRNLLENLRKFFARESPT